MGNPMAFCLPSFGILLSNCKKIVTRNLEQKAEVITLDNIGESEKGSPIKWGVFICSNYFKYAFGSACYLP